MYSMSGHSTGPTTHAAQLRADHTGQIFRSLEDSLEEAIGLITGSQGGNGSSSVADRLDTAFTAAEVILERARSLRP